MRGVIVVTAFDVFFGTVSQLESCKVFGTEPKMKRLCGALALLCFALPMLQAADDKSKADQIRVYVFTTGISDAGFTEPGQQDRAEAVTGLKKDLASRKFVVVDDQSAADMTAEVIDRGESTAPPRRTLAVGGGVTVAGKLSDVHVKISAGDYSAVIDGESDGRILGTKGVALGKAANKIETWAKENRAKLLATRPH